MVKVNKVNSLLITRYLIALSISAYLFIIQSHDGFYYKAGL